MLRSEGDTGFGSYIGTKGQKTSVAPTGAAGAPGSIYDPARTSTVTTPQPTPGGPPTPTYFQPPTAAPAAPQFFNPPAAAPTPTQPAPQAPIPPPSGTSTADAPIQSPVGPSQPIMQKPIANSSLWGGAPDYESRLYANMYSGNPGGVPSSLPMQQLNQGNPAQGVGQA